MVPDSYHYHGLRKALALELKNKGITDKNVLKAIEEVPRHIFLDSSLDNMAYQDKALPIDCNQTISAPFTVAFQSQLLEVKENDSILEIGTGSGYQTCVLCAMGARKVFSIERQRPLFIKAKEIFDWQHYHNVRCFFADGYKGLEAFAPFDKIIITCGAKQIPQALIEQLKVGGILVVPVGEGKQTMFKITKVSENELKKEEFGDYKFVPMLENKES